MRHDWVRPALVMLRAVDAPGAWGWRYSEARGRIPTDEMQRVLADAGFDVTPGCGHPRCRWCKLCIVDRGNQAEAADLRNYAKLWISVDDVIDRATPTPAPDDQQEDER